MQRDLYDELCRLRDTAESVRYEITSRGGGFGHKGTHRVPALQDVIEKIDDLVYAIHNAQLGDP